LHVGKGETTGDSTRRGEDIIFKQYYCCMHAIEESQTSGVKSVVIRALQRGVTKENKGWKNYAVLILLHENK